jgi:DNA polymerase
MTRSVSLPAIAKDAAGCTRCDLYQHASQTVFGEGPPDAAIVLVGEQPGDQEDKQGHPFVGPAGRVLDRALADSGLDRGKRRIHQRPDTTQIRACRPWVEEELKVIQPRLVVLLGAVAGESMFGTGYRVGAHKGEIVDATLGEWHGLAVGTIHPSAVLRGTDPAARDTAYAGLVADLITARDAAAS